MEKMQVDKLDLTLEELAKANKKTTTGGGAQRRSRQRQQRGGPSSGGRRPQASSSSGSSAAQQPPLVPASKLLISNLHYEVTEGDLRELFGTIGPLRKVSLAYDVSGRSKGTAELEFVRNNDAATAVKKFHGVALDKRPMKIELVARANILNRLSAPNPSGPASGGRLARGPGGRSGSNRTSRNGSGGGGRRNARPRSAPKANKTADQLDAEMDTYMTSADAVPATTTVTSDGDVNMG